MSHCVQILGAEGMISYQFFEGMLNRGAAWVASTEALSNLLAAKYADALILKHVQINSFSFHYSWLD